MVTPGPGEGIVGPGSAQSRHSLGSGLGSNPITNPNPLPNRTSASPDPAALPRWVGKKETTSSPRTPRSPAAEPLCKTPQKITRGVCRAPCMGKGAAESFQTHPPWGWHGSERTAVTGSGCATGTVLARPGTRWLRWQQRRAQGRRRLLPGKARVVCAGTADRWTLPCAGCQAAPDCYQCRCLGLSLLPFCLVWGFGFFFSRLFSQGFGAGVEGSWRSGGTGGCAHCSWGVSAPR